MIVRARTVVTMDGPPLENGAVAISNERIAAVGTFEQVRKEYSGKVIDVGERVLLPGLINAHCHLDYTVLRARIPRQSSFTDWIRSINSEKGRLSPRDYVLSINAGLAEAVRFGTTSIVNFEAFPEIPSEISSQIRIWWMGELIDVRAPQSSAALMTDTVGKLRPLPNWGLAPHAPFTASTDLYANCAKVGATGKVPLSTHVAESAEEMQMFAEASGKLYTFLNSIGRDMSDCGNQTPLNRFLASVADRDGGAQPDLSGWIIAHLNALTQSDFDVLASIGPAFHIVHCPRSHRYFDHPRFPFDRMRALGFNVSLGTDSLASNKDLSLFAEMQSFLAVHPELSPRAILQMVTVNPAAALGCADLLGKIRESFWADLIAIDGQGGAPEETIVGNTAPVGWIMIAGTILAA